MMNTHTLEIRVPYADADPMDVVYYANYLTYFERGRTELMRKLGLTYRDLESKRNFSLPVVFVSCRYHAPAQYDDLIQIQTKIIHIGAASMTFSYEISLQDPSVKGKKRSIAQGQTKHSFLNKDWKPTRIPMDIRKKLLIHVHPHKT